MRPAEFSMFRDFKDSFTLDNGVAPWVAKGKPSMYSAFPECKFHERWENERQG
jgi:hypothetical protein